MRRRIASIGRTNVYLHGATLLFAAYMLVLGRGQLLGLSFLSILLHECAHGITAHLFGYPPEEMELTPLGAMLQLEADDQIPPLRRFIILLAGPLMTALLVWLSWVLTRRGFLPSTVGRTLFFSNVAMLLVNLLPALPLDGGRMLALVLHAFCREKTVRVVMCVIGAALGVGLIACNVLLTVVSGGLNLSLSAAGCFLLYAGAVSTASGVFQTLRRFMDRKTHLERRGCLPCEHLVVVSTCLLPTVLHSMRQGRYTLLTVLESGTMKRLGEFTEDELITLWMAQPGAVCGALSEGVTDADQHFRHTMSPSDTKA